MTAQAASHVYFGLNPMWVSTCVLAITYATIMSEKVNRSIVALVGAGVMILTGVLDQDEAIKGSRLEHHRPAHRHDDSGVDLAPLRHVPVPRDMVGEGSEGTSRRHSVHPANHHRGAFGLPRQRHHGAADRSGHTRDLHRIESAGLSLFVRGNFRLQYRRHRDTDRRSTQYPDRLASRAHLQRFRLSPDAGDRRSSWWCRR